MKKNLSAVLIVLYFFNFWYKGNDVHAMTNNSVLFTGENITTNEVEEFVEKFAKSLENSDFELFKKIVLPESQAEKWFINRTEESLKNKGLFKGLETNKIMKTGKDGENTFIFFVLKGKSTGEIFIKATLIKRSGEIVLKDIVTSDDIEVYGPDGSEILPEYVSDSRAKEEYQGTVYFNTEPGMTVYFPYTDITFMVPKYFGDRYILYKTNFGLGLTPKSFQEYMYRNLGHIFHNGTIRPYTAEMGLDEENMDGKKIILGNAKVELYRRRDTPWMQDIYEQMAKYGYTKEEAAEMYMEYQAATYFFNYGEETLKKGKVKNTENMKFQFPLFKVPVKVSYKYSHIEPDAETKKMVLESIEKNDSAFASFTVDGKISQNNLNILYKSPFEEKIKKELSEIKNKGEEYIHIESYLLEMGMKDVENGWAEYVSVFKVADSGKVIKKTRYGEFTLTNGKAVFHMEKDLK